MNLDLHLDWILRAIATVTVSYGLWYFAFAAFAWFLFRKLLRNKLRHRQISPQHPTRNQVRREMLHSLRSLFIYGLMGGAIAIAVMNGWSRVYFKPDAYGWPRLVGSVVAAIFIHDTYFYWTHRLMHHRRLYALFHRTHHLSTSPTPWAAYAFSPWEAFVQAGIAPLVMFTIPIHPGAFALFMIWQIGFNVLGHCGYEVFPRRFLDTWLGRFMNTPTHHAQHHEKFRANFGLYFNVWDRLMGTNHPQYATRFQHVTAGEQSDLPDRPWQASSN